MKECGNMSSGCDHDCMECDVPSIEPESCQNCMDNAEDSGVEYEGNFTYQGGCWYCDTCRQPV